MLIIFVLNGVQVAYRESRLQRKTEYNAKVTSHADQEDTSLATTELPAEMVETASEVAFMVLQLASSLKSLSHQVQHQLVVRVPAETLSAPGNQNSDVGGKTWHKLAIASDATSTTESPDGGPVSESVVSTAAEMSSRMQSSVWYFMNEAGHVEMESDEVDIHQWRRAMPDVPAHASAHRTREISDYDYSMKNGMTNAEKNGMTIHSSQLTRQENAQLVPGSQLTRQEYVNAYQTYTKRVQIAYSHTP